MINTYNYLEKITFEPRKAQDLLTLKTKDITKRYSVT